MATRLMQVLFSAVEEGNEKLTEMVGEDIRAAVENGKAEDNMNNLSYEHKGDGVVAITDKETGEVTLAEQDPEGTEDEFQLWAPDEQIEGFAHPEGDGVTPGQQQGAPDEHVEEHVEGGSVANQPQPASVEEKAEGEEVCPECGKEPCECEKHEEKEFSTTNTAFQKVFSKAALVESLFSEVIESEETTTVGDLKFEKLPGEEAIVVTDKKTGHQVKVVLDEENLNVVELESKSFGEGEECGADHQESVGFWVIGLDADNHQLVESEEAAAEAAEAAAHRFEENGMIGVQIFEDKEEASDYARQLLEHLGADEVAEEVEEKEFSDGSAYLTREFATTHSDLMYRLFSEHVADAEACAEDECRIKDALEDGREVKIGEDVIIPLREDFGLIHDTANDEYTKVEVEDGALSYEKVDEDEADALKEEAFSEVYTNEAQTRFFSANEAMTDYMQRLFSEEADEEAIADAIESGEQVEYENEIITPVDEKTAVIEDKENGEFTKATLDGEEEINVEAISEDEADELTEDLEIEEDENEGEEEEKEFSDITVYANEAETKFFSEVEQLTSYMQRLFSEEADEEKIAEAIESGEAIEEEKEIITPIDDKVAIIEDKENGEFTKATLEGEEEDEITVEPIEEEEAKELLGEETPEEEEIHEEKEFSTLDKFFAEVAPVAAPAATVQEVTLEPGQSVVIVDENGNPVEQPAEEEVAPSVEVIEDKALAAVQSIQEAAAAAEQAIQEAKAAPAENAEAPLQEAQFSQKTYSENQADTLLTWLKGNIG